MTNVPETTLKLRTVLLPQDVNYISQVSTTLSAFVTAALSNMQVPQLAMCVRMCVLDGAHMCDALCRNRPYKAHHEDASHRKKRLED